MINSWSPASLNRKRTGSSLPVASLLHRDASAERSPTCEEIDSAVDSSTELSQLFGPNRAPTRRAHTRAKEYVMRGLCRIAVARRWPALVAAVLFAAAMLAAPPVQSAVTA